jgi:hypothetical protein
VHLKPTCSNSLWSSGAVCSSRNPRACFGILIADAWLWGRKWRQRRFLALLSQVKENGETKGGEPIIEGEWARCALPDSITSFFAKSKKEVTRKKIWWPEPESNQRHADFQSAALPTELSGHVSASNERV